MIPDPHFRTWDNYHYSYHGACDMVFLHNEFLDVHIRTELIDLIWSTITSAAIRIGGVDIVEVTIDQNVYYNQSSTPVDDLNVVRETHHLMQMPAGVIVLLPGGHFIMIQALGSGLGVYVRASFVGFNNTDQFFNGNIVPTHFYNETAGMGGTWNKFGLVGRDGTTKFVDVVAFAREWQVRPPPEDPMLFINSTNSTCVEPRFTPPDVTDQRVNDALAACSGFREGYKQECAFDFIFGDVNVAENPVYTFQLETSQQPSCSATNVTCYLKGGTCINGCNSSVTDCFPGLCGDVEGGTSTGDDSCLCSVPMEGFTICFSGSALVNLKDGGTIPMRDLKLGDEVMVADGRYERVYSFGHYQPEVSAEYLQISFSDESASNSPLEISPDHLLFTSDHRAVEASSVRVGDTVMKASGEALVVVSIRKVSQQGAYAPFTPSGVLAVNGVLASCYIGFEGSASMKLAGGFELSYQFLAHLFETPHRLWCMSLSSCRSEFYTEEGLSLWHNYPLQLSQWLVRQSTMVKTSTMMTGLIIFLPLRFLEVFLHMSFEILFALCVLVVSLARLNVKPCGDKSTSCKVDRRNRPLQPLHSWS